MSHYAQRISLSGIRAFGSRLQNVLRDLAVGTSGSLSFEWILLSAVVVLSAISAIGTVRDALVNEFGDLSIAVASVNQSFTVGGRRPASFIDSSKSAP